jgi:hypothetical protein
VQNSLTEPGEEEDLNAKALLHAVEEISQVHDG